ncbi:MAG: hypothetical protein JST01_19775 [Cyanobacteria bacterium SZAS TMP-1]|nr:hypothetical protein [Cyanobacteria bacterium SZAS TMP-1]
MEKSRMSFAQLLLNVIFIIPVTLRVSGKWLCHRAYGTGGWARTLPVALVGLALGVMTGWQAADRIAFEFAPGAFSWLLNSSSWFLTFLLVASLVYTHVWSALYYFALRHLWDLWERAWRAYERIWKSVLLPGLEALVKIIKVAPGSTYLWSHLEDENGIRSKEIRLLEVLCIIAIFGAGGYSGYLTYELVSASGLQFVGLSAVATTLAVIVAGSLVGLISPLFDSKAYASVAAASAMSTSVLLFLPPAFLGQTFAIKALALFAMFVFGVAYMVPALVIFLQGGFMKKVLTQWRRMLDTAYGEETDKDYQRFFQHALNIVLSFVLTWIAYSISISIGFASWLAFLIAALTLVYTYAEGFQKHLGQSKANTELAIVSILSVSYLTYQAVTASSAAVAFGLSLAAFLATALIAYPFFYIALRFVSRPFATSAGYALEKVHARLSSRVVAAFAWLRRKQDEAFNDRSEFAGLFGHLLNVAILAAALTLWIPSAAAYATSNIFFEIAIFAFVSVNGFILLGRLFSSYSGATLGFFTGLSTFAAVAYFVNDMSGSLTIALLVAGVASGIVGGVVAPLFYLQVARLLAPFTATLAPPVNRVFNILWSAYRDLWIAFGRHFAVVLALLQPLFAAVARTWQTVAAQLTRLFGA